MPGGNQNQTDVFCLRDKCAITAPYRLSPPGFAPAPSDSANQCSTS